MTFVCTYHIYVLRSVYMLRKTRSIKYQSKHISQKTGAAETKPHGHCPKGCVASFGFLTSFFLCCKRRGLASLVEISLNTFAVLGTHSNKAEPSA